MLLVIYNLYFISDALQIGLQNNGCTNGVDNRLVLTLFLLGTALQQGFMSQYRGEAFIVQFHGNIRKFPFERGHKRTDISHAFGVCIIHLFGMTYYKPFNRFASGILLQKLQHLCGFHRSNARSNNLRRVGGRYSGSFFSVIDRYNSSQGLSSFKVQDLFVVFVRFFNSVYCCAEMIVNSFRLLNNNENLLILVFHQILLPGKFLQVIPAAHQLFLFPGILFQFLPIVIFFVFQCGNFSL